MDRGRRAERLNKYYDLLSEKPAEEQAEVLDRKRSGDALRALMSAEAPIELVERFSHRYAEVLDKHFSSFEKGRINATRGEYELARDHFDAAMRDGDKWGLTGIADMLPYMMDLEKINFLKLAISEGVDGPEVNAKLGELYMIQEQTGEAVDYFSKARDKSISTVIKEYYEAEVLWNTGKKKKALDCIEN